MKTTDDFKKEYLTKKLKEDMKSEKKLGKLLKYMKN